MTIEIAEFKCPACGHLLGKEEYKHAFNEINRKVQATCEEQVEKLQNRHYEEMIEQDEKHRLDIQKQAEVHRLELEEKVSQHVQLRLAEYEERSTKERAIIEQKYEHELRKKDEEIETAKLQTITAIDDKIKEAVKSNDEKHRQKETEFQLHISRIEKREGDLLGHIQKLQQTIDNVPPEFRGTAGEIVLFDDLHAAFPQDHLTPKTVGVEMPDVVQTIMTENGETIATPILWDKKTGENITPTDIEKAKKYKEKYNTDYCFVVKAKPITSKDSKNCRAGLIAKRDGILLVHQSIAIGVAEETRNFIIEKTRLIKNNNGRASKQIKLYDYITSRARFRRMQEKMEKRIKLEELIRKQEDRNKKIWNEQKKIIQEWFELDKNDEEIINEMIQQDQVDEEIKENTFEESNEDSD
jgi:hypothetical protein